MDDAGLNRLLIVEDDRDICTLIGTVARNCGYAVTVAGSAQDCTACLDSWKPTHVILDLHMPDVDGVELLRLLAAHRSTAQVLIISGTSPRILDTAERIGRERGLAIAGTLAKPFQVRDIKARLEALKGREDSLTTPALLLAIENGELTLVYQPKVDMPTLSFAGFEALVRWRHPTRGLLAPGEFLHLAEESLMDPLTEAVLRMGVGQLAAWAAEGMEIDLSLNISGRNLHDVDFADTVIRLCRESGVPPQRITLELTETAAAENVLEAMDILTRLRIKGVKLSIDDFGTGYSSLVQLHRLPFTDIKIDKAFVSACHRSRDALTIVRTIVDLAHNLGMTAVAEGVENAEIVGVLADLHCDGAQGYHINRPLPAPEAIAFARNWRPAGEGLRRPAG